MPKTFSLLAFLFALRLSFTTKYIVQTTCPAGRNGDMPVEVTTSIGADGSEDQITTLS